MPIGNFILTGRGGESAHFSQREGRPLVPAGLEIDGRSAILLDASREILPGLTPHLTACPENARAARGTGVARVPIYRRHCRTVCRVVQNLGDSSARRR